MKIEYLFIDGYKNLSNFEAFFEKGSPINAIIGNNGSGKSNILEALATIFSKIMVSDEAPNFTFDIVYSVYDNRIRVENRKGNLVITKNDELVSKKKYRSLMPITVFLYYAGETKRLKDISENIVDKTFEYGVKSGENPNYKAITYLSVNDFGASLLTNQCFNTNMLYKILELLDLEAVSTKCVLNLQRPYWSNSGKADNFWNATGHIANTLTEYANQGSVKLINQSKTTITLDDYTKLRDDTIGASGLFKNLKILFQAGILESIDIDVIKDGQTFDCNLLSEGEKQISNLLSILNFTKDYRALFLLDEFDSYLHPSWQRKFAELIKGEKIEGQILFTTHSPLTLGKMCKDNILILKEGKVFNPAADTYNRDITEVLEEVMEVGKRPPDVEGTIKDFRNAAMRGEKENALSILEQLKEILSADDPFFITVKHLLSRLEG